MTRRKDETPSVATYADHEVITPPHELRKAVPHNPVDFVESTGLAAFASGPDSHERRSCGTENSREACWLIS